MRILENGIYRTATADEEMLFNTVDKETQIEELKQCLTDTDYQAIKFAEGWLSVEEYEPIKAQRQNWRNQINILENGG